MHLERKRKVNLGRLVLSNIPIKIILKSKSDDSTKYVMKIKKWVNLG